MSKIVTFIGSPRKQGYTTKLLNQVVAGAKAADTNVEVITYDLNDSRIKGCQGCFYCRSHEGCATDDPLQAMYQDIKEANGIVVSFPLYFGGINGQSKIWLDRMYPMLEGNTFEPRYPGKKVVTIYAQGNKNPNIMKNAIDTNNGYFKLFGWELIQSLLVYDTSNLEKKLDDLTKTAFEAGKILAG